MATAAERDLFSLSIEELAVLVASRAVSVQELTALLLDRIEAVDPILCAYFHVFRDEAEASAAATDGATLGRSPPQTFAQSSGGCLPGCTAPHFRQVRASLLS